MRNPYKAEIEALERIRAQEEKNMQRDAVEHPGTVKGYRELLSAINEAIAHRRLEYQEIENAINNLPDSTQQQIARLAIFDRMPQEKIAEEVNYCATQVCRILKKIKPKIPHI